MCLLELLPRCFALGFRQTLDFLFRSNCLCDRPVTHVVDIDTRIAVTLLLALFEHQYLFLPVLIEAHVDVAFVICIASVLLASENQSAVFGTFIVEEEHSGRVSWV